LKKVTSEVYTRFLEELKPRLEEQFNYVQNNEGKGGMRDTITLDFKTGESFLA